jgi:hypothetical protein
MAAVRKKGNCVSDARKVVVRAADRRPTALFAVMMIPLALTNVARARTMSSIGTGVSGDTHILSQ